MPELVSQGAKPLITVNNLFMKIVFIFIAFSLLLTSACRTARTQSEINTKDSTSVESVDSTTVGLDVVDTTSLYKKLNSIKNSLTAEFQDYNEFYLSLLDAATKENQLTSAQRDSLIRVIMQLKRPENKVRVNTDGSYEFSGAISMVHSLIDSVNSSLLKVRKFQSSFDSIGLDKNKTVNKSEATEVKQTSKGPVVPIPFLIIVSMVAGAFIWHLILKILSKTRS